MITWNTKGILGIPQGWGMTMAVFVLLWGFWGCAITKGGKSASGDLIAPGAPWLDNRGQPIQAHGGGILRVRGTYYWFGEERAQDNERPYHYVGCYSSRDLTHWTFRKKIKFAAPPGFNPEHWVLERPKVFYNKGTGKYVMYFHLDDGRYKAAEVGVAVSDQVDGDYRFVSHFRPLGQESRDIGQFIDDDGTAYLIFEDRPAKGFVIARLSSDYLQVEKEMCLIKMPLEGGALVHVQGLYYVIGSHLTGWGPNPNLYATATSLEGPWSEFKDIAPPETRTYGSQSSMLLKVTGSKKTTIIFMGDIWKPQTQWDSRYLWMPLDIGPGRLWLPKPQPWKINVRTGKTDIPGTR